MKGRLRGRMGGSMTAYKDRSKEELLQEKSQLEAQYKEFQGKGLKLDDGCTGQLYRSEV